MRHPRRRNSLLILLGLVLLLSLQPATASAQDTDGTVTLAEYEQLISDTQQALQTASDSSNDGGRQALVEIADRWERVEQVTTGTGERITVDHTVIVAQLRAPDPDLAGLEQQLAALLAVSRRWSSAVPTDLAQEPAMVELEEILSRPEFQWAEDEPSWQQWLWERLLPILRRLLPDNLAGSNLLRQGMTALALLFLVAVLLYVARTLFVSFSSPVSATTMGAEQGALTSDSALRQAQELSHSGDYRSAVRYLYLSTLLLLDERRLLRFDRTKTNREYVESVVEHPELAKTLKDVIDVFDRVWYGYQTLDSETYHRYEQQVRQLQSRQ